MASRHDSNLPSPYQAHKTDDDEIAEDIRERLSRDERVDARGILVTVEAGVATLTGDVDTLAAKRAAGADAWVASGIADVRNLLAVREGEPAS